MKPSDFDNMLPAMKCDQGCGECCGVTPASQSEFDRVNQYARDNGIKPADNGMTCPWYQGGTCAVYPARPLVCRMFGHVGFMVCPRGYNANVRPEAEEYLMRQIPAQAGGKEAARLGMRLLHEAVISVEEIAFRVRVSAMAIQPLTVNGVEHRRMDEKAYHAGRAVATLRPDLLNIGSFCDVSMAPEGMR